MAAVMTMGGDPEVFLFDRGKQLMVPSCGRIPDAAKGKPKQFKIKKAKMEIGVLEDNVTLEFNFAPIKDASEIRPVVQAIHAFPVEHLGPEMMAYCCPEWSFMPNTLAAHPGANVFGCSADLDAHAGGAIHPPITQKYLQDVGLKNHRFAGGHVHLGIDPWPDIPKHIAVQFLDLFIGIPNRAKEARLYGKSHRDSLYGRLGNYRETSYGIEYRTPSNYWASDTGSAEEMYLSLQAFGELLLRYDVSKKMLTQAYNSIDWVGGGFTSNGMKEMMRHLEQHGLTQYCGALLRGYSGSKVGMEPMNWFIRGNPAGEQINILDDIVPAEMEPEGEEEPEEEDEEE